MTESGSASLSKFTHAIAEFIDNSIEATQKMQEEAFSSMERKERVVSVDCIMSKSPAKFSYVVICDNGPGLCEDSIIKFATYAFSKAARGEAGPAEGSASIGKFGVGAKQSGFWLGDRIHIITKSLHDVPVGQEDCVSEFAFDEETLRERFMEKQQSRATAGEFYQTAEAEATIYKENITWRKQYRPGTTTSNCNCEKTCPADERDCAKLMEIIASHEERNPSSFTAIVVRFRKEMAQRFFFESMGSATNAPEFQQFPSELAQIYHFHLHPEHHPVNIHHVAKFKQSNKDGLGLPQSLFPKAACPFTRLDIKRPTQSNLKLYFSIFRERDGVWSGVRDFTGVDIALVVDDPVGKHIAAAKTCFRFQINIPKPEKGEVRSSQGRTQRLGLDMTGQIEQEDMATVVGVLFYFPYIEGRETRPLPSAEGGHWHPVQKKGHTVQKKSAKSRRNGNNDDDDDDDDDFEVCSGEPRPPTPGDREAPFDLTDEETSPNRNADDVDDAERAGLVEKESTFDVYWSDRLVPKAKASSMPWFPDFVKKTTRSYCEDHKIPYEWRGRIKGYLFFEGGSGMGAWDDITNNKLDLNVPANGLDNYMQLERVKMNMKNYAVTQPANINKAFQNWVKDNHKHFDKEFKCTNRNRDLEGVVRSTQYLDAGWSKIAIFSKCAWTSSLPNGEAVEESLQVGDHVKLYLTPLGRASKNEENMHIVKVVGFSDQKDTGRDDDKFEGTPYVHYLVMPLEVYHSDLADECKDLGPDKWPFAGETRLRALFANRTNIGNIQTISKRVGGYRVPPSELKGSKKEMKKKANSIRFLLFPQMGKIENSIAIANSEHNVDSDNSFYKFGFQILDGNDCPCLEPLIGPGSFRCSYKIKYELDSGPSMEPSMSEQHQLWWFDPQQKKDVPVSASAIAKNAEKAREVTFAVYGPSNKHPINLPSGKNTVKLTVIKDVRIFANVKYEKEIFVKEFVIYVASSGVKRCKFDIEDLLPDKRVLRSIGTMLPRIQIDFLDEKDRVVSNSTDRVKVIVSCKPKGSRNKLDMICYYGYDENRNEGPISSVIEVPNDNHETAIELDLTGECGTIIMGSLVSMAAAQKVWDTHDNDARNLYIEEQAWGRDRKKKSNVRREFHPETFGPIDFFQKIEDCRGWFKEVTDGETNVTVTDGAKDYYHTINYGYGGGWRIQFPTDGTFLGAKGKDWQGIGRDVDVTIDVKIKDQEEWKPLGSETFTVDYRDSNKLCSIRPADDKPAKHGKIKIKLEDGSIVEDASLEPVLKSENGEIIVRQGQALPELSFQCFDRYGLYTCPPTAEHNLDPDPASARWAFRVEDHAHIEGRSSSDDALVQCTSTGRFTLRLKCRPSSEATEEIPSTGLRHTIKIFFDTTVTELRRPWRDTPNWLRIRYRPEPQWELASDPLEYRPNPEYTGLEQDDKTPQYILMRNDQEYRYYARMQSPPFIEVPIVIMPDQSPHACKVFHCGQEVATMPGGFSIKAGEDVTDLTLQVYDKNNVRLDLHPSWFEDTSSARQKKKVTVQFSWDTSVRGISLPAPAEGQVIESIRLPDIKADWIEHHAPNFGRLLCAIVLHKIDVNFDFEINSLPSRGIEWRLCVVGSLGDDGLVSGSAADFASKILCVCHSDVQGRAVPERISASGGAMYPLPKVLVYSKDPSGREGSTRREGKKVRGKLNSYRGDDDDDDDDDDNADDGDDIISMDEEECAQKEHGDSGGDIGRGHQGSHHEDKRRRLEADPDCSSQKPSQATLKAKLARQYKRHHGLINDDDEDDGGDKEGGKDGARGADDDDDTLLADDDEAGRFHTELMPIATLSPTLHTADSGASTPSPRRDGYWYFPLDASIALEYTGEVRRFVWIVVTDTANRLKYTVKRVELTNGPPAALQVRAPSLQLLSFVGGTLAAKVSSHAPQATFEVRAVDADGLPAHVPASGNADKDLRVGVLRGLMPKLQELKPRSRNPPEFDLTDYDVGALFSKKAKGGKGPKRGPARVRMDVTKDDAQEEEQEQQEREKQEQIKLHATLTFAGKYINAAGAEVLLKPVVLECEQVKLNNVVRLRVTALGPGPGPTDDAVLLGQPQPQQREADLCIACDVALPALTISAETDDGVAYLPAADQVTCTVQYSARAAGGKRKAESEQRDSAEFYGSVERDEAAGCLRVTPRDPVTLPGHSFKVGFVSVVFTYRETRHLGPLGELGPHEFTDARSDNFAVRIVAGAPFALVPQDNRTSKTLASRCTVSNSPKHPDGRRIAAHSLSFHAVDRYDNEARMSINATIYCHLRKPCGDEQDQMSQHISDMPALVGADPQGFVHISPVTETVVTFSSLELQAGVGMGSGPLELVFRCPDVRPDVHNLREFAAMLEFTDDAERARMLREIEGELSALREKITEFEQERDRIAGVISHAEMTIKSGIEGGAKSNHLRNLEATDEASLFTKAREKITREISDMEKADRTRRKAKLPDFNDPSRLVPADTYRGTVASLGYVDDEKVAQALSWAAGSKMRHSVVTTLDAGSTLLNARFPSYPLENMEPFLFRKGNENPRERNDKEKGDKKLPGVDAYNPGESASNPVPGNPKAMVNLIQLADKVYRCLDAVMVLSSFT